MSHHHPRLTPEAPIPYALIDSGGQQKLERFGDKTLVRPSTVAVWRKRADNAVWSHADATYEPDGGWRFHGQPLDRWHIKSSLCTLALRLQTNGQIGLFPEHAGYLPDLVTTIERLRAGRSTPVSVLNLFAYTGMASVVAARAGAIVTHVDLSKRALDWARENIVLNSLPEGSVRLIPEDAIGYLTRLTKKGQRFDIIVADPPSFSRVTAKKTWSLDEVTPTLIDLLVQTLEPGHGDLFLSSHHFEIGAYTFANLLNDRLDARGAETTVSNLALHEETTGRILPAGFLVRMTLR